MRSVVSVAIVGLVLAAGVVRARQLEEQPVAAAFALKIGTSVRLRGSDLVVGLVRVADDSRCPMEARCVTAGDAAVVLSVRRGREAATNVTVHTMAAPREATRGAWRIQLVDLAPQPSLREPRTQKDYVATLRVDAVK